MKIVCISDTHGMEDQVDMPSGDLLIHAGDITNIGELDQLDKFNRWLGRLNFKKIVVIPGNHDRTLVNQAARDILTNCDLLVDSMTTYNGFNIYGSPWTPWFGGHYWAFNLHRGADIKEVWDDIPTNTDILITHGPPYDILDSVPRTSNQGCMDLLTAVQKIKPRAHFFGHLHDNHGVKKVDDTIFVNASICTESYQPINPPIIINL